MSSRLRAHILALRHSVERSVAPHVEEDWAEAVLFELRLRDVTGPRIGAALAEVDSHCAESGESAREAFGDPVAYARSLDLPTSPPTPSHELAAMVGASAVQALGMLAVLWGFQGWLDDRQLGLTGGMIALVATLLATLALLGRRVDSLLRAVVRHPFVVWLLSVVHMTVLVALLIVLDDVVLVLDAGWTIAAGAVLLAAGTTAQLGALRRNRVDPVVAPLAAPAAVARTSRAAALAVSLTPWLVPLATGLLMLPTWLIHR